MWCVGAKAEIFVDCSQEGGELSLRDRYAAHEEKGERDEMGNQDKMNVLRS